MTTHGSVLLDTSIVINYFRQDPDLQKKIDGVQDVYLPLVVLGELRYGANKSTQRAKMHAQVKTFLKGCILLLPNETTAGLYGEIKAELSIVGKPIPQNDIWIGNGEAIRSFSRHTRPAFFIYRGINGS